MTVASIRLGRRASIGITRWAEPVALATGLAAIVGARWWATRSGADALVVGAAFGIAMAVLAAAGPAPAPGRRFVALPTRSVRAPGRAQILRQSKALGTGLAFGLVLIAIVVVGSTLAGASFVPGAGRPAAPFLPWAAITILVAGVEEALLRGRLFDAIRRPAGVIPAVLITTIAFALMHVPLYGWHVVPLDLAVGLAFAGLRLATGGVVAPAAAHAVADLATWWL